MKMKKFHASVLLAVLALSGPGRLFAEGREGGKASPFRLSAMSGPSMYTDYVGFIEIDVPVMAEIQFMLGEIGLSRGQGLRLRALGAAGWQSNDTYALGAFLLTRLNFDIFADTAGLIPFWPVQIPLMAGLEGAWAFPRGFEIFLCLRAGALARIYPDDADALLMMQAALGCTLMLGKRFGLRLEAGYGALDVDPMRTGPLAALGAVFPL
jgi:hypothetical protein